MFLTVSTIAGLVGCGKEASNIGVTEDLAARTPKASPTTISNVLVSSVTKTSFVVTWKTSTPANSQAFYTGGGVSGSTELHPNMVLNQIALPAGLTPGTVYNFQLRSIDATGIPANYNFAIAMPH